MLGSHQKSKQEVFICAKSTVWTDLYLAEYCLNSIFPSEGQSSLGFVSSKVHSASFGVSAYSFNLSTATMLVSTSEAILTSQFKVWVTDKA